MHFERLLNNIDDMYEAVVTDPSRWSPEAIHAWAGDLFVDEAPDKMTARSLRRVVRAAIKLRTFWLDPSNSHVGDAQDWRSRVDIALGGPAWRPALELAEHGLLSAPSDEMFDQVQRRFRTVHNQPWLEGVTYEEWIGSRSVEPVDNPEGL